MQRPRVLLAILVYGGSDFVPACLQSAAGLRAGPNRVDVLVLDDCSPDEAWAADLARICASLDIGYYRSPRNIGIPRSMNLALLRARSGGYDHVIIANSDVVFPLNLATVLVKVAEENPDAGSVTAWSNNVSIFSLRNTDRSTAQQDVVDWVSYQLEAEFGTTAAEIPTAVGFCMLVPTPVAARVGLFDPLFGRGYCEEVDWSQRAKALGYRNLLAPAAFVFHYGGASTAWPGCWSATAPPPSPPTSGSSTSVTPAIAPRWRPSSARRRSRAWWPVGHVPSCGPPPAAGATEVEATSFGPSAGASVPFLVRPDTPDLVATGHYCGFATHIPVPAGADPAVTLQAALGRSPVSVTILDRGRNSDRLATAAWGEGVTVEDRHSYPEKVW